MPLIAILSWPLIALIFFVQLPFARALVVSTLVGYLLLPERFEVDLPGLPPVDKPFVLMLGMLLGALVYRSQAKTPSQGERENQGIWIGRILICAIVVLFLSPVMTILSNRAPLFVGPTVLPGMRPWDLLGMALNTLYFLVPFLLARRYLATPEMHRMLLTAFVTAGLLYSLLVLFEVRMSPQLHNWVYGYHQHSFVQHIRDGAFRPKVFLEHGLWVGFFLFTVTLAAVALVRSSSAPKRIPYLLAAVWLFGVLFLSRNLGAWMIAITMIGLLFVPRIWQIRAVFAVVIPFLLYPALRQAGLVPTARITEFAADISANRAQSFQFRLENEDQLLARALEKPVFGWGTWGRGLIYNDQGERTSTSDGTWIIVLGAQGWVGYLCLFALLTLPLLALKRVKSRKEIPIETIALALIMTGNIIYLIPNATLTPLAWLTAGALAGFVQFDQMVQGNEGEATSSSPRRTARYTRFAQTRNRSLARHADIN
ncbi:MAG: hypothetical protein AAGF33_00155 [Pseudomonadota bacterium]